MPEAISDEIIPYHTVVICRNCKWPWSPKTPNPKSCPHCSCRDWDSGQRLDISLLPRLKRNFFLG